MVEDPAEQQDSEFAVRQGEEAVVVRQAEQARAAEAAGAAAAKAVALQASHGR
jgi:hypothetical protein